ncbi:MAG: ATP-binding protein [Myxococcales bacterium]
MDLTEALQAKNEELDRYFASSLELFCILDLNGRFLRVNPEWGTLGYSASELEGRSCLDFVHPDDVPSTVASLLHMLQLDAQKAVTSFENRYRGKDGSYHWLAWRSNPQGAVIYASARDVTWRKRAEQELLRRIAFEDLLVGMSSTFLRAETDSLDLLIEDALRKVAEFVGGVDRSYLFRYGPSMETMSNTHEWCAPGIEPEKDNLQDLLVSLFPAWNEALRDETTVYIPDLSILPETWAAEQALLEPQGICSLLLVPVVVGTTRFGFLGFASVRCHRDWGAEAQNLLHFLSDNIGLMILRVEQNQALRLAMDTAGRLADEKDLASRAKSAFLANMSHEIRTPMNAILGFAQILERDKSLTLQQTEQVQIITRSGTQLLRLINDVLEMSKIEAGRSTLNRAAFCLHDLLEDLEIMFRMRADAKGLQFVVDRDSTVPRYATGDAGKLRQILVNLLGNAIKFTSSGGVALRLCAQSIAQDSVEGPGALRLVVDVEDSGPGIAEEEVGPLFEPFYQARAGLKAGGTGLGLAISRTFVEMMGGKLTVASNLGQGSCFHFDALLGQDSETAGSERTAVRRVLGLGPGTGVRRILVVDDMPDNRTFICELLRPVGFETMEACNGIEALRLFEHWAPHAVLMDMRMPLMDGYEATRRLRATLAGSCTPIIAITASAFDEDEARVMASGVNAYLRKPVLPESLFEVLGTQLKLSYVFADDLNEAQEVAKPDQVDPAALVSLPRELIVSMREAVADGDMERLKELLGQVEAVDGSLARALRGLADRYDYGKLNECLQ